MSWIILRDAAGIETLAAAISLLRPLLSPRPLSVVDLAAATLPPCSAPTRTRWTRRGTDANSDAEGKRDRRREKPAEEREREI
jgi:hypothetical protein